MAPSKSRQGLTARSRISTRAGGVLWPEMTGAMARQRFGMRLDDDPRAGMFGLGEDQHFLESRLGRAAEGDRGVAPGLVDDKHVGRFWRSALRDRRRCISTDARLAAARWRRGRGRAGRYRPADAWPADVQDPRARNCRNARRACRGSGRSAVRRRGPDASERRKLSSTRRMGASLRAATASPRGEVGLLPQTPTQSSGPGAPRLISQPESARMRRMRGWVRKPPL